MKLLNKKIIFLVSILIFSFAFTLPSFAQSDIDGDSVIDEVDNCPVVYNPDQNNSDGTPASDFVSYWKFDEDSGTTAMDSTDSNPGTTYGTSWVDGKINGALSFDGVDDYVDAGNNLSLQPDSVTTEAWIYLNSLGKVQVIQSIRKNSDVFSGYELFIDNGTLIGSPANRVIFLVNTIAGSPWEIRIASNTILQINKWYHVVGTYDSGTGTGKLYVNGVEENSDSTSGKIVYVEPTLRIGKDVAGVTHGSFPFNGLIDEVAIYNKALLPEEIQQHYQNGLANQGYLGDSIGDVCDNCPSIYNPDQLDSNNDEIGDACTDSDNDEVFDVGDNCPAVYNPDQTDLDEDDIGDACDNEIIIATNTVLQAGEYNFKNLIINNNSVLTLNSNISLEGFKGVKINADNLIVEEGSSISADGKGYPAGEGPGAGNNRGGGGYGGYGGRSPWGTSYGGPTYGSAITPTDLGSSGWVPGGGAIKIVVFDILAINGSVTADGDDGLGGGSGGSVYITAKNLTGSGTISADGGNGLAGTSFGFGTGGGGGGRIAIYYQDSTFEGNVEANKGETLGPRGEPGEDGTVVLIDTLNNNLYTGHSFRFQENDSPFNFNNIVLDDSKVNTEGSIDLSANELTANNSNFSLGGAISTIAINKASIDNNSKLTLQDSPTITISNSLSLDATSSLTFNGHQSLIVPAITLNGNSTLTLSGNEVLVIDEISLSDNSTITHLSQGKINLIAKNLTIDPTSSISADGKGYPAYQGPGTGYNRAGGGYGGYGGRSPYGGSYGGPTYGSAIIPIDLGSGGWSASGGGAIKIVVFDILAINGSVTADGDDGLGGGSGGSVYITAKNLTGSGTISADGGNGLAGTSFGFGTGGGGGGRIAIYYQDSTFEGNVEANKGETLGPRGEPGEDGTVVLIDTLLEFPSTTAVLSEKIFTDLTLTETLISQKVNMDNALIGGDLSGTLNFTNFEMVRIETGSFADNGFSKGEWQTNLEGIDYTGIWEGMFFLKEAERKIYLKGIVSGEISGIVDGYLTESVDGSGVYDQYQAEWRLNRVGTQTASATINLTGTINYNETIEYPSTAFYVSQISTKGTAFGYYNGLIEISLTQVRIADETNPYDGQGFLIISYDSDSGSGEGWAYNKLVGSGRTDMKGQFTDPLLGVVSVSLIGTKFPKILVLTIERVDLYLLLSADLRVKTWTRYPVVRVGRTTNFLIKYRNDGQKAAEDVTIIDHIPLEVEYISSSEGGEYNEITHEVFWHFDNVVPGEEGDLSVNVRVPRSVAVGTEMMNIVSVPKEEIEVEIDPTVKVEFSSIENVDVGHSKAVMTISNQNESIDLNVEISIQNTQKSQFPKLEERITEEGIELYGQIPIIQNYIPAIPSESILAYKVVSLFNPNLPDYLPKAAGIINKAIVILNTFTGYKKDTLDYLEKMKLYEYTKSDGRIGEDGHEKLVGAANTNLASRAAMMLFSFIGGVPAPPNNENIDDIKNVFEKLEWGGYCNQVLYYQIKHKDDLFKDRVIKDCSDIRKEFIDKQSYSSDSSQITTIRAQSPEDKYGPIGFDYSETPPEEYKHFVPADQNFRYLIDFWNKEDATAPTQEVFIKDQLDSNLDWNTFKFKEFGFLDWVVKLEPWQQSLDTVNVNIDTRPEMDLIVNVEGNFDSDTGEIEWTFRSLDPETMEIPENPMAGFLPPITESGHEIGWVVFSIDPNSNLTTGTQISNQAFVKFDFGPWKPAPKERPFTNTIDATPPVSSITDAILIGGNKIQLNWAGNDEDSGIKDYTIYVSVDDMPYEPWLNYTTETSTVFIGEHEHIYSFYSIAQDNVGNFEQSPDEPDIIVSTFNAPPIADANGPYTDNESSEIIFDASASFDPDGDALQYRWDFENDGIWDTEWSDNATATFTWDDDYQGIVALEVSDGEFTDTATTTITILNVPPIVEAGLDQEVYAGDTVQFNGAFSDPGWLDAHTIEWDFGDGIIAENSDLNPSHIYYEQGIYTVTLTVEDDDGGMGIDTLLVDVQSIPAIIDCNPNTLNLKSNGKWITCYIELPEGYDVWQIDGSMAYLNGIPAYLGKQGWATAESNKSNIKDYDKDGILERMVKFDRQAIQEILEPGEQNLFLSSKVLYNAGLADFVGKDVVRVTQ